MKNGIKKYVFPSNFLFPIKKQSHKATEFELN